MAEDSARAREWAMKAQEVILRNSSKQLTSWQGANILRISPQHLRRVLQRYPALGCERQSDWRMEKDSPRRVPLAVVEQILNLYR